MNTGKASIKLATAQTLTADYVVTTIPSYSITEESVATIDFTYVTGAAEAATALNFVLEFSYDGISWTPETYTSLSSGTNTLAPMVNAIAGGAGATTYTGQYVVPFCSRNLRIKVKETGVGANFGNVTVILTVAAASGQERNLQAITIAAGGDTTVVQPTASNLNAQVVGNIANDSVDSGNPVKVGGQARTTNPTAVADGDRVNATFDKLGKQVVVGSIRDLKDGEHTVITSSTAETTIATAVASTFLDLYGLVIDNSSATVCTVTIKDSTAGTTRFTFTVPGGDTRGFMLPESAARKQSAVNNNWTATCGTSVASISITTMYVKNT